MVASISPDPRLQFFANDGSPLVGGKLYTYAAGTTTPLVTYTSNSGLTPNTNPVILDSRGEASVWFGTSKYKFVLKDANDVEIWTQDNLQGAANADGSNAYGTWPISITGNAATATVANSVVAGGAVNKIIAGTNITISPTTGVGDVTVNASTSGGSVTSVTGAGVYGFTLPGGPITTSGTLTVTPPTPGTSGNVLTSDGTAWTSAAPASGGASITPYAVGSYALCTAQGTEYFYGQGAPGSLIFPSNANGYPGGYPLYLLSGSWICMGYTGPAGGAVSASLFVRVA